MTERFTDKYLEYTKEFTDCPDVFLMWGALLAISASLSRSVYVEIGSWNISPHIWIILIGKSSSHKSTAISRTEDLIEIVDSGRLAPAEFSQEAIIQALAESSNRIFIFDEAKSFFDTLSKRYNEGLKSLFTILYRKPNYTRTTMKHGSHAILGAYITMGMATTPEWLRQSLEDAEQSAMSGFLARFLMIPYTGNGNKPMYKPPPHDYAKFEHLKEMLIAYSRVEQVFHYTPEADKALDEWYSETTNRENEALPILGPFFEHFKNEAIHKLCIIFSIDRGEKEITLAGFKEAATALGYIEEMLPQLVEDMTSSKWDHEHKKIGDILRKHGTVDRTTLSRISHCTGQHLTAHLTGFTQDKLIITKEEESKGKKPRQSITWTAE